MISLTFLEKSLCFNRKYQIILLFIFQKDRKSWVEELLKVNQIDIPDYQQYLSCIAKRMGRLMVVKKSWPDIWRYPLFRLLNIE